jgi:hypothetical protein
MTQATESPAAPSTERSPGGAGWAALAGVLAGGAGLAIAELVAAVVAPGASTLFAGGAAVVDAVPPGLKDVAVEWFGTNDKVVLLATMGAVLAVGAALGSRRRRRGRGRLAASERDAAVGTAQRHRAGRRGAPAACRRGAAAACAGADRGLGG